MLLELEDDNMVFRGDDTGQLFEFGSSLPLSNCLLSWEAAGLLKFLTSSFAFFTRSTRGDRGEATLGSGFGDGNGLFVGLFPIWISKMLPLIGIREAMIWIEVIRIHTWIGRGDSALFPPFWRLKQIHNRHRIILCNSIYMGSFVVGSVRSSFDLNSFQIT